MDGDFQNFFIFPFVLHTTKKLIFAKYFVAFFKSPPRKPFDFANSFLPFRPVIQRIFQNAEQSGEISCPARIGNAENEISATVWAQKKQETVL
jgi:hypothetical protein|nr:hypothetical protein [bacterium]